MLYSAESLQFLLYRVHRLRASILEPGSREKFFDVAFFSI